MIVGVALFELHIGQAQSLKEKRMVVKSLKDKIRSRFDVSIAEVAFQDLHQRARIALTIVSGNRDFVRKRFDAIAEFVETEAEVAGWTEEFLEFDAELGLDHAPEKWGGEEQTNEEDT